MDSCFRIERKWERIAIPPGGIDMEKVMRKLFWAVTLVALAGPALAKPTVEAGTPLLHPAPADG